jgi:hypothetical protein
MDRKVFLQEDLSLDSTPETVLEDPVQVSL